MCVFLCHLPGKGETVTEELLDEKKERLQMRMKEKVNDGAETEETLVMLPSLTCWKYSKPFLSPQLLKKKA